MPLVSLCIESLEPYRPGKPIAEQQREVGITDVLKLASNENPLGPPPRALEALHPAYSTLHLYPNGGLDLRETLAAQYKLKVENVIAGSGSEGIMSNIIRTFLCDEDEALTSGGTFVGF
jgi:histidinol-phosphate aminotransferase